MSTSSSRSPRNAIDAKVQRAITAFPLRYLVIAQIAIKSNKVVLTYLNNTQCDGAREY